MYGWERVSAGGSDITRGEERVRRRAVHGWCMYDWANSAFATSIGTAILPVYFVVLFKDAFGQETTFLGFAFTGSSMWSLGVAVSAAIVACSSPILGMIADRSQIKRTMLQIYTTGGAIFTVIGFFSAYTGEPWAWVLVCYAIANIGFAGGIVFYNSLLPHLGGSGELDKISSRGYAYGYVGGGLLLAVHLAAILAFSDTDHVDLVTRLAVASVGLWWLGWAQWTFRTVPEPRVAKPVDRLDPMTAASVAFSQVRRTFRELARLRMLGLYLAAYLLFNDGIQTVLTVAGAFGPDTLGISLVSNMGTVLIVQFVAAGGAVLFGKAAGALGAKTALTIALGGWCVVIAIAVGFAPLVPEAHEDFDYRLEHTGAGEYEMAGKPDLSDEGDDSAWGNVYDHLLAEESLSRSQVLGLVEAVRTSNLSRFGVSVKGGELDGTTGIGPAHPSVLVDESPLGFWPRTLRDRVWEPLGIAVDIQWLMMGALVGIVLGGSQALARSLFAYMTPESRSAEFFGFFGFVGRASAVFGPTLYLLVTGIYDTRAAILAILIIIAVGTVLLQRVDPEEGRAVAVEEDRLAFEG
jgi:UMF1 family MFS transporter